ncbi:PIN domain-containing protein [Terriglobus sp.]|uniref:PIN domain-containing protein n=1 Tax=Terriglobus sp. TaxID=1889013 RepID=UPI003AFFFEDB
MSGERYTLDANILFYALDERAGQKHKIALSLLKATLFHDCVLTVQTLGETYNAIARRRPELAEDARSVLSRTASLNKIVAAEAMDFTEALRLREKRQVQFWDAMLWATAKRHRCTTILTEDLHDRPVSEGVRYLNPFQIPADPDLQLFLLP